MLPAELRIRRYILFAPETPDASWSISLDHDVGAPSWGVSSLVVVASVKVLRLSVTSTESMPLRVMAPNR